jgi:hypothetical protein
MDHKPKNRITKMNIVKKILNLDLNVQNTYNEAIPMPPNDKGRICFGLKIPISIIGLVSIRPLGIYLEYRNLNIGVSNALLRDVIEFKAAIITNLTKLAPPVTGIGSIPKDFYFADKEIKAIISETGSNDSYGVMLFTNLRAEPDIASTEATAQQDGVMRGMNLASGYSYDTRTQNSQMEIPKDILNNLRVSPNKLYLLKGFFEVELASNALPK